MTETTRTRKDPDLFDSNQAGRTLHRRLVLGLGAGSLLVLGAIASLATQWIDKDLRAQVDAQLLDVATRAAGRIERFLGDHQRLVELLGSSPSIVDAARSGAARARQLALPGQPMDALERRFDAARSLDIDPRVRTHLRQLRTTTDAAEILLTDVNGFNVVTTARTSDFVQNDEEWWQRAMRDGFMGGEASYDESARTISVSMSGAIRESPAAEAAGIIKVVFNIRGIEEELARVSRTVGLRVELIDGTGMVIASTGDAKRMQVIPGVETFNDARASTLLSYRGAREPERAAVQTANGGRWRLVAHLPERVAFARLRQAKFTIFGGTAVIFGLILGSMIVLGRFVARRVSKPAAALAEVAERVADGDLVVQIAASDEDDEIGRLSRAIETMVAELRRLVSAIRGAAQESAAMAAQITAGSEQMSAAASEMAQTSNELSQQSTDMAETIQRTASDAGALVQIAARLTEGARDGVERNKQLRGLSTENRVRLDESARALAQLVAEANAGAAATEALATASEEIRAFVVLVRKLARQSKLLALNAAMEAARAGEQGEGFAVVASEIRKLAATSTDAAERTEAIVAEVMRRVEESRASSKRTMETVAAVQGATREAVSSFHHIERAVIEAEQWAASIELSWAQSNNLVTQITSQLELLAKGTETFAAAMQEVAASSQQQSASTEQIAAAASMLASAAERLSKLVRTFRTEQTRSTVQIAIPNDEDSETVGPQPASLDAAEAEADAQLTRAAAGIR